MSWLNQITSQFQNFAQGLDQEGNPTAGDVLPADGPIDVRALLEERSRLQDTLLQLDAQHQEERSQMILIKDELQTRLNRAEAEIAVLRNGGAPAADHEVDLDENWGDDWGDGGDTKQKLDESSHEVVELQKSLEEAQRQLSSVTELRVEVDNLKHENVLLKNKLDAMQEENEMLEAELDSRGSGGQGSKTEASGKPQYDYEGFCKDVVTTLLGGSEFSTEKIKEAREGLKLLSSKVQSFEEKTESVAESLEELEDQRNAIRAEKAALEEELRRLSEVEVELKQVRSQLKKATDDKTSLSTKIEKSMRSQAELQAKVAELSKNNEQAGTSTESVRISEWEALLQSERQAAQTSQLELETLKKSSESEADNLKARLTENETRIAEYAASLEAMRTQLDLASNREAALTQELQNSQTFISQSAAKETEELRAQLRECRDRLAEYENSWEQMRSQCDLSSSREAGLTQEVQNLQNLISELQNRNLHDENESSRLLKQTREQESDILQLRAEVAIANDQLVECQQKIAELETSESQAASPPGAASETAEEVAGLRQRLETSEKELELLRDSRACVVNELETTENNKQHLLAQITGLQQELEAMKMIKQSRDQSLEQLANEKKQMITVVNEKARENADLQSRLNGLMSAISDEKQARLKTEQQYADYQQRVKLQTEQYEQQLQQQQHMLQQQQNQLLQQQQQHQQQQLLQAQRVETPPVDISPFQNKISTLENECQNISRTLAHKNEENLELRQRIQRLLDNESKMKLEIQRLTSHLVEVEDTYTKEAVASEERTKVLQQRLTVLEESARNTDSSAQAITAQASQKAEMFEAELVQALSQRDEALDQVSTLEDQLQQSAVSLASLQLVLEHMQSEKDNGTKSMRKHTEAELKKLSDRIVELETALAAKEETLKNMSETIEATSKLTQQLQDKNTTLSRLQQKLNEKEQELQRALEKCRRSEGAEGKVEKQLIKNMLLGYFTAAPDKKPDVMRCITGYLEFTEDENRRMSSGGPRGLFGIFGGSPAPSQDANDSFTNQLIAYIEKESTPSTPLRLPTEPVVDRLRKVSSSSCPPEHTQRQLSSSPFRPDNPLFSHLPASPITPSSTSSQASTTSEPEVLREILAQPSNQP